MADLADTVLQKTIGISRAIIRGCIPEGLPKWTWGVALGGTLLFQMYVDSVGWPFAYINPSTHTVSPSYMLPWTMALGAFVLLLAMFRAGGGVIDAVLYWLCGCLLIRDTRIAWPADMYQFVLGAWLWSTVVLMLYGVQSRMAQRETTARNIEPLRPPTPKPVESAYETLLKKANDLPVGE